MKNKNRYKSPGVSIYETEISYRLPSCEYFCNSCHQPLNEVYYPDITYCIFCKKSTGLISKQELTQIRRDEKIDKLINYGN